MYNLAEKYKEMSIDSRETDTTEYKYMVMSIDVGITNLGISISKHTENWSESEIISVDLIDLAKLKHKTVSRRDCSLHHTGHIVDRMEHLFQEWDSIFTQCEYILCERQPPVGITSVEALIYQKYRHKTHLIHPTSMHKHFNISHLEYDQRKEKTVEITLQCLEGYSDLKNSFNSHERKHDMADSVCLQKYWTDCCRKKYISNEKKKNNIDLFEKHKGMNIHDYFDMFKYKGPLR
jgi:hypothetical protein